MQTVEKIGTKQIAEMTGLTVQMIRHHTRAHSIPGQIGLRGIGAPGNGYQYNRNDLKLKGWIKKHTIGKGEPKRCGRRPRTAYQSLEDFRPVHPIRNWGDFEQLEEILEDFCKTAARRINHRVPKLRATEVKRLAKKIHPLVKVWTKLSEKTPENTVVCCD